jgi:hypothetical protein
MKKKTALILLTALLSSCVYVSSDSEGNYTKVDYMKDGFVVEKIHYTPVKKAKKIRARITYYSRERFPQKTASGKVGVVGVTVAAHPDFPFGTKIFIPDLKGKIGDGYFKVQNRGSAVTKKTAARGKEYVFDVFVLTRGCVERNKTRFPDYMDVYIFE